MKLQPAKSLALDELFDETETMSTDEYLAWANAQGSAAPLKPKKAQEFDLGALPLFGDQAKQKELF